MVIGFSANVCAFLAAALLAFSWANIMDQSISGSWRCIDMSSPASLVLVGLSGSVSGRLTEVKQDSDVGRPIYGEVENRLLLPDKARLIAPPEEGSKQIEMNLEAILEGGTLYWGGEYYVTRDYVTDNSGPIRCYDPLSPPD